MKTYFSTLLDHLLSLIYPERCAACGGKGSLFCLACQGRLRPYPPEPPPADLDAVMVAWLYNDELRRAIHALKYYRRRRVALALADALAATMPAPPADALIPVPLHDARLAERGFNQAEVLARQLGHCWGLPVCHEGLCRERDTGHQAHLGRQAREGNVAGAFLWRGPGHPPRRPLLVDDVLTTGATLSACAEALRGAGSLEVRAVALARSLAPGRSTRPHA
ncbi:MAG: ComF family protein [Oscillochloridaceae bacterium umkhey_bin13]